MPRYRRVHAAIDACLPSLTTTQATNLALLVSAILVRRTLCLSELARVWPRPATPRVPAPNTTSPTASSACGASPPTSAWTPVAVQTALVPHTIARLGTPRWLALAIDWTMFDAILPGGGRTGGQRVRYQGLRIAVPRRGRALPLLEVAYDLASSGSPWPVELTALTTEQMHPWRHPAPFDFHYSEMWRQSLRDQLAAGELERVPRTDPDLAAHITTPPGGDRVVLGAPVHEVFPKIPEADFRQAILADLEWISEHSTRIYGVLNACRVLAYLHGQGVLSKTEAVHWALANLPAGPPADDHQGAFGLWQRQERAMHTQEVREFVRWAAPQVLEGPPRR